MYEDSLMYAICILITSAFNLGYDIHIHNIWNMELGSVAHLGQFSK